MLSTNKIFTMGCPHRKRDFPNLFENDVFEQLQCYAISLILFCEIFNEIVTECCGRCIASSTSLNPIFMWNTSKWWFINFISVLDFQQIDDIHFFSSLLVSKGLRLRPKTLRNLMDWHSMDRNIIDYQYLNVFFF